MPRSSKPADARCVGVAVLVGAILVATTLAGCSDAYLDRRMTVSHNAGDAVASNRIVQTVDPWPPYAANNNIAFNGDKMRSAAERYRTGKVIEPQGLGTTAGWKQQGASQSGGALDSDIGSAKSAK